MWTLSDLLLLLSSLFVLLVLSSLLPRWKMYLKFRNLPPGPFCWPLLGYVPFLNKNSNYLNLKQLSDKFGGIFSLHVGSRYVVVIHDFEVLKEVFLKEEFLEKPSGSFRVCPDSTQRGLSDLNGEVWREHRIFWLNAIRHMSTGLQSFRNVTMCQVREIVNKLESCEGQDVQMDHMLELVINNVSLYLGFGKPFPQDHSIMKLLADYNIARLTYLELNRTLIFFPWIGKLVSYLPKYKNVEKDLERMDVEIKKELLDHQETLDANDPRDFLDLFLLRMQREKWDENYNISTLLGTLKVLFVSSIETTRNALVWFTMLMAKHPEIQEEIQKEIDSVLGVEREPLLEDKTRLPLLEAAILETLRFRNFLHLSPMRQNERDTKVQGYDIPKDTIVIYNFTSQFRNPKYWSDPDKFDPGRFLSEDRKQVQVPEHFIPFSYGKRNCVGEKVATSTLFLFSASLLQKFTFKPPEGGVNMNIKVNFTNGQESPFLQFHSRFKS